MVVWTLVLDKELTDQITLLGVNVVLILPHSYNRASALLLIVFLQSGSENCKAYRV